MTESVKGRAPFRPEIGIVLGSGLGGLSDIIKKEEVIDFSDIPGFPVSTVEGHSGRFIFGKISGRNIILQQGRVHLYEGFTPEETVIPVRFMKLLGIECLVLTNAAGAVNKNYRPGDVMVIEDHISFLVPSCLRGPNLDIFGVRFPDMNEVYDEVLTAKLYAEALKIDKDARKGIYAATAGPQFETPSEIRAISLMGADAVGMSTVNEAIAAKHAGLKCVGISAITNMAAGLSSEAPSHEETLNAAGDISDKMDKILTGFLN